MLNPNHTSPHQHDRYSWTPPTGSNVWHLAGYVENGVTYESHEFWVEFRVWAVNPEQWKTKARPDATLWVRHGGGVESVEITHHFARALRDAFLSDPKNTRGSFQSCWGVFDLIRGTAANVRRETQNYYLRAFAWGWMKKRKIPNRHGVKVWIEDPKSMCGSRFFGSKHTIATDTDTVSAAAQ